MFRHSDHSIFIKDPSTVSATGMPPANSQRLARITRLKPRFHSGRLSGRHPNKNTASSFQRTQTALAHTSNNPKTSLERATKAIKERNISTTKALREPQDSNFLNAPKIRGRNDDSLSRFPNLHSPGGILRGLDYGGTITFALSGSITAAQSGLDVFGCSVVAMITAVGGGTIRDAVFLARRPFWTSETEYIWMTVLTGFVTFFTWPFVEEWNEERKAKNLVKARRGFGSQEDNAKPYDWFDAAMDSFDAVGLSAFAIIGAQNGVRAGMPVLVSAICGMATSTFGGLMRDVICGRPVRIVHSNAEIYAETALAGALTYLGANSLRMSPAGRIGSAMFVCLGSRCMAIKHDVKLYTWETENDGLGVAIRK